MIYSFLNDIMPFSQESKNKRSWHDGELECNLQGGHLVIINDEHENRFAHDVALHRGTNLWIGLSEEVA